MMTNAVKYLLAINIIAYLICLIFPLDSICALYYIFDPLGRFQPFQLITYMFMHGGTMHIFFNMFALWMFGRHIEMVWGTKRFLIYYFICGIGAAVFQELGQLAGLINPYSMTVGASGAVYGILLAFGMLFPNERMIIFPVPVPIKAKFVIAGYIIIEIFAAFFSRDNVAHLAHLGGLAVGFVYFLTWKFMGYKGMGSFKSKSSTNYNKWQNTTTRPTMKVEYNRNEYARDERSRDYQYNEERNRRNAQIDEILDKIRKSGYESLTDEEKQTLFNANKK